MWRFSGDGLHCQVWIWGARYRHSRCQEKAYLLMVKSVVVIVEVTSGLGNGGFGD